MDAQLSLEQQKALAIARAKVRLNKQRQAGGPPPRLQQAYEAAIAAGDTDKAQRAKAAIDLALNAQRGREHIPAPKHYEAAYDHQTGEFFDPNQRNDNPQANALTSAVFGAVEGVPVLGKKLREGAEKDWARINWLNDAIIEPQDSMEAAGARYDELYEEAKDNVQHSFAEYPKTRVAGNVVGAVAGTAPLVAAAPTAMGAAGTMVTRTAMGGASGAVIGAADSAVRSGGDMNETLDGAKWGAGFGIASPYVGKAAGHVGRGMRNAGLRAQGLLGLAPEQAAPAFKHESAKRSLQEALAADGIKPSEVPQRLAEVGDGAMPLDLGPNMQRRAGKLASIPGPAQKTVRSAIKARDDGANAQIKSTVDATLGKAKTPAQVAEEIKVAKDALGPQYDELFATQSRRVDTTDIAENLDAAVVRLRGPAQKALADVRRMLNVHGTDVLDPNPATLHQTRQAIDGITASSKDPKVIAALTDVRKQIDARLGEAVPGIKRLDSQWADLAEQGRAFETGRKVLDNGKTTVPPEDLARALQQRSTLGSDEWTTMVGPDGQEWAVRNSIQGPSGAPVRLKEGVRAEIERILGVKSNDRVALQGLMKGDGSWNTEKLTQIYGPEKTRQVMDLLDRHRLFADSSQIVTRNSETAARLSETGIPSQALNESIDETIRRTAYGGIKGPMIGRAGDELKRAVAGITRSLGDAADNELAQMLTAGQESEVVKMIAALRAAGEPITQETVDYVVRSVMQGPAIAVGVQ